MKATLFDLSAEYRATAEKLADLDLDDTTIADTLDGMAGELQTKCTNIAALARNLESTANSIKDAEAQMKARRQAIERRAERLKHYLLHGMQHAGISKVESPWFCLSIKNNPPAVEVFEPGLVPAEFMKQPEPPPAAPDKAAIKAAIKAGQEVPGCRITQGTRLDIS